MSCTNNAKEAYHHWLRSDFKKLHAFLSILVDVLKFEDQIASQRLRAHELDHSQPIAPRPCNAKYDKNDDQTRSLMENFDVLELPTAQVFVNNLRALQYRFMKNDFNTITNERILFAAYIIIYRYI